MALTLLGFLTWSGQGLAEVVTDKEEQTGLRTWEWREAGVSIKFVQRLPDQTRAFFQARGFNSKDADVIAGACVFQTIFRNDGEQPFSYDLDDWHTRHRDQRRTLLTREHWKQAWQHADVGDGARIALHWSLLPTRQRFDAGDYNWGMTSFGLPPGAAFDLTLVMESNGTSIARAIPGMVCPKDESMEEM